ncbi:Slc33a1 [Symbiodinium sp. CCMP2592]|nr:Slc33a1 [Symbiodinium sp. CCMP2592]
MALKKPEPVDDFWVKETKGYDLSPYADELPLCEDLDPGMVGNGGSCWSTCQGQCPNDVLKPGLAFDFDEIRPGHPGCTSHFECVGNFDRVLCHAVRAMDEDALENFGTRAEVEDSIPDVGDVVPSMYILRQVLFVHPLLADPCLAYFEAVELRMSFRGVDDTRELESLAEDGEAGHDAKATDQVSNLTGEYLNIFLLLVLYTLQGIPMGLSGVVPLILKEQNVSFAELGTFSLNSYPFSLKLLWAPVVDAVYSSRLGRRKTWLLPTQLAIGFVMIVVSQRLDHLLYAERPNVESLTVLFFLLYFLCATQDIAVDGWALTMLRKENVGYAATTNAMGQTLGYAPWTWGREGICTIVIRYKLGVVPLASSARQAMGFTGFMALEHFNLITLSEFMFLWGMVFIVVTILVTILKSEGSMLPEDEPESIETSYANMFKILRLRPVRVLLLLLLTMKFPFAVADSIAPLKLQEYGVKKEHMAYIASGMMPVYILLPAVVSRWTTNSMPWDLSLKAYPWRILLVPVTAIVVSATPPIADRIPWAFYAVVVAVSLFAQVASQCMFVSTMAFFARISDPAMGGTYMTMLNTMSNLGGMWPGTVTLKLIDFATCMSDRCVVKADGFYVMSGISFIYGIGWCLLAAGSARRVQQLKLSPAGSESEAWVGVGRKISGELESEEGKVRAGFCDDLINTFDSAPPLFTLGAVAQVADAQQIAELTSPRLSPTRPVLRCCRASFPAGEKRVKSDPVQAHARTAVVAIDEFREASSSRRGRPQRARLPVLRSWCNERVVYERLPGSSLPTLSACEFVQTASVKAGTAKVKQEKPCTSRCTPGGRRVKAEQRKPSPTRPRPSTNSPDSGSRPLAGTDGPGAPAEVHEGELQHNPKVTRPSHRELAPLRSLLRSASEDAPRKSQSQVVFTDQPKEVEIESFKEFMSELWYPNDDTCPCELCGKLVRVGIEAWYTASTEQVSQFTQTEVVCKSCRLARKFEEVGGWFLVACACRDSDAALPSVDFVKTLGEIIDMGPALPGRRPDILTDLLGEEVHDGGSWQQVLLKAAEAVLRLFPEGDESSARMLSSPSGMDGEVAIEESPSPPASERSTRAST